MRVQKQKVLDNRVSHFGTGKTNILEHSFSMTHHRVVYVGLLSQHFVENY